MIVLTREPGEAEKLATGPGSLQRRYGMPADPAPYSRPASSEPACRAFVAARLHAPELADALLRRLRARVMVGGLLDDPELIAAAAGEAGLEPAVLLEWCGQEDVAAELEADAAAARAPLPAARALDHKLGGPREQRRYTAPSYELTPEGGGATFAVPGFNPVEVYETAIANLAPGLERRPKPRVGRRAAGLGRHAARHCRGRADHATPPGRDPCGAEPRRAAARGRRRRLLDALRLTPSYLAEISDTSTGAPSARASASACKLEATRVSWRAQTAAAKAVVTTRSRWPHSGQRRSTITPSWEPSACVGEIKRLLQRGQRTSGLTGERSWRPLRSEAA